MRLPVALVGLAMAACGSVSVQVPSAPSAWPTVDALPLPVPLPPEPVRIVHAPLPIVRVHPPTPAPPWAADRLIAPGVDLRVVAYADCAGAGEIGRGVAALDVCFTDRLWFAVHNPGPGHPLLAAGVGAPVVYAGPSGLRRWRVIAVHRDWPRVQGESPPAPGTLASIQTCEDATPDGRLDRVLDLG